MATYKIEPVPGGNYKLEINDGNTSITKKIRVGDIPGIVQSLGSIGYMAEKIECHLIER